MKIKIDIEELNAFTKQALTILIQSNLQKEIALKVVDAHITDIVERKKNAYPHFFDSVKEYIQNSEINIENE